MGNILSYIIKNEGYNVKLNKMGKIVTIFLVMMGNMMVANAADMKVAVLDAAKVKNVAKLTTEELQREVEKRIDAGDMCFEMGLELIKRWTKET